MKIVHASMCLHILWHGNNIALIISFFNLKDGNFCCVFRNPENDQTGSETVSFFNIFVHDPDLINVVKQQLQKKDRIFIKGLLGYKPETDQNGRKKFSGHIEAENILKIDRFSEAAIENPVEFSN